MGLRPRFFGNFANQRTAKENIMRFIERLRSSSKLALVQAFEMKGDRHVVVVQDQDGDYWAGINLPILRGDEGPHTRNIAWKAVPRVEPMGPCSDKETAILLARAVFVHEDGAAEELAAHTKKLMRRTVNTMWQKYNRSMAYAVEASYQLNVPQWATKPEGGANEMFAESARD
jgi:hypothetical protein